MEVSQKDQKGVCKTYVESSKTKKRVGRKVNTCNLLLNILQSFAFLVPSEITIPHAKTHARTLCYQQRKRAKTAKRPAKKHALFPNPLHPKKYNHPNNQNS
jgi:hypothetical protein